MTEAAYDIQVHLERWRDVEWRKLGQGRYDRLWWRDSFRRQDGLRRNHNG